MQLRFIKYILLFCFMIGHFANAQNSRIKRQPQNLKSYDNKRIHFGFMLGLAQVKLAANYSQDFYNNENYRFIELEEKPGFNVGIIADYKLNDNLNLRFVPALTLTKRQVNYWMMDGDQLEPISIEDESALMDIPIQIKYRSDRLANVRPYLLGGFRYIKDMSSKKDVEELEVLRLQDTDFALTLGAGVDFYLEYFKLGIEMKYQHGFNNLLVEDESIFSQAFESIHHRGLFFSLTFE